LEQLALAHGAQVVLDHHSRVGAGVEARGAEAQVGDIRSDAGVDDVLDVLSARS
jgi:hypothetical protein